MGLVSKILDFRLNIDTEYQGWMLLFATLTAIWIYCLPCYCAGMSLQCLRRGAAWIQMRLPYYLAVATIFNAGMLILIIKWLPDWEPGDYINCGLNFFLFLATNMMKFMTSIAFIIIFVFVVAFKDRIFKLLGMDHKTVFRFKLRDMFAMGTSTRAIEVMILKVEDLPAASLLSPNNVFIEVHLGYNEPMKTRVHNNAGSNCMMKETLQLNFDENEDEDILHIFVKNQKVMGAGELGRLELKAGEVYDIERDCKNRGEGWAVDNFIEKKLMPRGSIWLRIKEIADEEVGSYRC